ncbi:hypothetical protein cyc_04665 [Cyclospora cayetanensis]|uniref:Uncharacterized protein n=1 Tax=Cyclospora cayetanensis TaxID=88456 RepID=A0A1D3CZF6_9EIME|nr:hypothetical protein cyc_04665 [Cyclospora cayetanensis]
MRGLEASPPNSEEAPKTHTDTADTATAAAKSSDTAPTGSEAAAGPAATSPTTGVTAACTARPWVDKVLPRSGEASPRVAVCLCQQIRLLEFIFKEKPKGIAFALWGQEIHLLWLQGFITKVDEEANLLTFDDGTQTLEYCAVFVRPHPVILEHEALAEFRLERLSLAPSKDPNAEAEWMLHVSVLLD